MRELWQRNRAALCGMTIVEILVALIVFAVVGTMTLHFVLTTGRVSKEQTSRLVREASARIVMESICKDLQNLPAPALTGNVGITGNNKDINGSGADSIQFVTSSIGENDQIVFAEVFYGVDEIKSDQSSYTVIKRRKDDKVDGQVGGSDVTLSKESENYSVRLNLQYRSDRNLNDKAGWKDAWNSTEPLPKAIRINLEIEDTTANPEDPFQRVSLVRVVAPKAALPF